MSEIDITCDGVGTLYVYQPRKGFRFSTDALLLFSSISGNTFNHVLEIGSGCGIISFLLTLRYPHMRIDSVEIQTEMVNCMQKGITRNQFQSITLHHSDIRDTISSLSHKRFDCVFSNPPYRVMGSGRLSPYDTKNIAIYDSLLSPDELFDAITRYLADHGLAFVCFPHDRRKDMLDAAHMKGLYCKEIHIFMIPTSAILEVASFSFQKTDGIEIEHTENTWKNTVKKLYEGSYHE